MDNQPTSGKTYALIIGVGNYPQLPTIANTVNDATDLHTLLTAPTQGNIPTYNVRLLLDAQATASEIDNKLNWLADTATRTDTVIIYFSGHGFTRSGGRDAGSYISPYDTDPNNLFATAFSSVDLSNSLGRINAARLALFLDSCYSAGTIDSSTQPGVSRADYLPIFSGQGRALFASSQAGEVSFIMPDARNSLFTAALLEVFSGRGVPDTYPTITTSSTAAYLNAAVTRRNPNQHPYAIIISDFTLVPNPLYKADGSGIIAPPLPLTAPALPPIVGKPSGGPITSSQPMIKIRNQFNNTGSGPQNNNTGSGTQNNVFGTQNNVRGNQYNSSGDQFIGNGNTNIRTGTVTNTGGTTAIGSGININQTSGGPTAPANPNYSPITLHQAMIRNRLVEEDLQLICQYLGFNGQQVDYASLAGTNPTLKALALIQYCQQHNCLASLIDILSNGPDNWQSVLGNNPTDWRNWATQQDSNLPAYRKAAHTAYHYVILHFWH